jgi:hypothetical protein
MSARHENLDLIITASPGAKIVVETVDITGLSHEHCYFDGVQWVCSGLIALDSSGAPQQAVRRRPKIAPT